MTEVYSDDEFAKFCSKLSSSRNEELIRTIKVFNAKFLEIFKTDYYEKKSSCRAFSLPRLFFEELIFANVNHYIDSWLQFLRKEEEDDVEDYFLSQASILVQFLTILCRSQYNLQIVHKSNIADKLLQACSIVSVLKFCPVAEQVAFITNVTYLLECLHDPYLKGRCSLLKNKKSVENDNSFVPSSPVHNNVKVFIIEMMRMLPHSDLAGFNFYKLISSVASLFVAIIHGDMENASHMICPATIDTIFEVLLSAHYDQYPLFCHSISSAILALSSILPEKIQLEISMVVDRFWDTVVNAKKKDYIHLMGLLIDEMTFTIEEGKKDIQQLFVDCGSFKKLYLVLEKTSKWNEEVVMAFLRLIACLLKGNNLAQMTLEKEAGYGRMFNALTRCCEPSKDIWRHLICMIVEIPLQDYQMQIEKLQSKNLKIQNAHLLLYLLRNLSSIADDNCKHWLSTTLSNISLSSWDNKVVCVQNGVVDCILSVLLEVPKDDKLIDDLVDTFEKLASVSLTSDELKKLMRFFDLEKHSQMHPKFRKKLLRSLIQIASSKDKQFQITFWDFSPSNSCLTVDNDFVLTANGFSLHAWIRFNTAKQYKNNFHFFSMKTIHDNRLDIFFDDRCSLSILLGHQSFVVEDVPMNDGNWHCIGICHTAQRGLFGHRQFNVYVDGVMHLSLAANFPLYSETVTECRMGYSSGHSSHLLKAVSLESSDLDIDLVSSTRTSLGVTPPIQPRSLGFLRFFKTPVRAPQSPVPPKKEATRAFDSSAHLVPLVGCMAEVMIFNEPLNAPQFECLFKSGLNPQQRSCIENEDIISICSKAILWYNAKASSENICYDLSKSSNNAKVAAKRCSFNSIKNLLNAVGGIQAFLAIMDQASQYDHREISMYGFGLKEYIDLLLLLVTDHPMNLESFVKCDGMATLGLYLRNVDTGFIDLNLLESLKNMFALVSNHSNFQVQMLDYVFFNFRIWKRVSANVLYALIEILKKIAEDKKDFCRKKYGVQFLLDVYSVYFGKREDLSTGDNYENYFLTDVRKSLCILIKTYLSSGATSDELWQIMAAFCHSTESMSSELARLIVDIFESASKNDQVYLFMCNVKLANLLHAFLVSDSHSVDFKECIVKILDRLLKSSKINESYKSILRISESEYCQGFIKLLSNSPVSDSIVEWFINQLFSPENPNLSSIIHIVRLCASVASLNVRIKFMQKLVQVLHNKPSLAKPFNEIPGWPHELLKLLIIPKSASFGSPGIETNHSIVAKQSPTIDKMFKESKVFGDSMELSLFDDPWSSMKSSISRQGSTNSQASTPTSLGSPAEIPDSKLLPLTFYCSYLHLSATEVDLPRAGGDDDDNDSDKEVLLYFILFFFCDLAWRNSDEATVDEKVWKIREDTIVAMEEIQNTKGLITKTNLAMRFFEIILLLCTKDLTQLPTSSKQNVIKNSLRIVKHLYCFMNANKANLVFTEKLLLNFTRLMDEVLTEQSELQSSFDLYEVTFLLTYISQKQHKVEAIKRLHEMISLRPALQFYQRVCFILDNLNKAMEGSENSEAMKSLMETFLDRCYDLLNLERELPDVVRPTNGKHSLRIYKFSRKWQDFISKVVEPSSAQEKANMLESVEKVISEVKGQRCEDLVVNLTRRNREEYESELKFKANHLALLQKIEGEEKMRLKVLEVHDETREALVTIKWKQAKKIFHCERGFWPAKTKKPTLLMIAPCENYMKMRPRLMEVEQERMEAGKVNGKKEKQRSLLNVFDELKKYGGMKNPVDQLTDEEWEKLKSSIDLSEASGDRKASVRTTYQECELVTIFDSIQGELELSPSLMIFKKAYHDAASSLASLMLPTVDAVKMSLENLKEIHFRKFNLQRTGLELFFTNQCSCFLNFKTTNVRNKVFSDIVKILPREVMRNMARSPKDFLRTSEITQKWVQREISNFEYLMQLNSVSGRTYNDLSQYPVFPWILSDYTSTTLNLDDPNVFRDFSWPVGALNPNNRDFLREKFSNLRDTSSDRKDWFHYGTHYSNPAGVMLYLLRLEPFTTLHKQLHGGNFDLTDRQFNGLPSTWHNLLNNSNDVKELIPEFFYLPEFLRNVNGLEMGKMQASDELFDDVKLPAWAKSPSDFIHKHMDALESDHVSANLNKWIDLIFGYKQKGDGAIESLNVFHYYTYEDSLDPNEIPVGNLRKGYEDFVKNFGQTPSQLFTTPHPKRLTTHEWLNQTGKLEKVLNFFNCPKISKITTVKAIPPGIAENLVYISSYENNLLVLTSSGLIGVHSWQNYDKVTGNQFALNPDNTMDNHKNQKKLVSSFCLLDKMNYRLFSMIPKTKLLVTGGHWDNSLRVYNVSKFKLEAYVTCHTDIITCVAADRHGRKLATGSKDGSCLIWDISHKDSKVESLAPTRALCGHAGRVTSIALSCELNVVASSSEDGSIIIYNLDDGSFSRCVRPPRGRDWKASVENMAVSDLGYLCVYVVRTHTVASKAEPDEHMLHMYNINGRHISMTEVDSPVTAILMCERHALVGFRSGEFAIRKLFSVDAELSETFQSPVACICATEGNGHIVVGLEDSTLKVFQVKAK